MKGPCGNEGRLEQCRATRDSRNRGGQGEPIIELLSKRVMLCQRVTKCYSGVISSAF